MGVVSMRAQHRSKPSSWGELPWHQAHIMFFIFLKTEMRETHTRAVAAGTPRQLPSSWMKGATVRASLNAVIDFYTRTREILKGRRTGRETPSRNGLTDRGEEYTAH